MSAVIAEKEAPLRLDLGCGPNAREGFLGVDRIDFKKGNMVADLREKWPWADNSVDEVHCSHFVEHLAARERIHFCNELYRVLKPGAKASIIVPHWNSSRAYGDMTHQWPPVSEFWFYYLSKEWRAQNAPHDDIAHNPDGYSCDFACTWGYAPHPALTVRAADYQQHAFQWFKEAIQDLHATFEKK